MARYSVNNYTVETLLASIKSGGIAIPEMQRPFVWDGSKVRDLIDSLYKGFPVSCFPGRTQKADGAEDQGV